MLIEEVGPPALERVDLATGDVVEVVVEDGPQPPPAIEEVTTPGAAADDGDEVPEEIEGSPSRAPQWETPAPPRGGLIEVVGGEDFDLDLD